MSLDFSFFPLWVCFRIVAIKRVKKRISFSIHFYLNSYRNFPVVERLGLLAITGWGPKILQASEAWSLPLPQFFLHKFSVLSKLLRCYSRGRDYPLLCISQLAELRLVYVQERADGSHYSVAAKRKRKHSPRAVYALVKFAKTKHLFTSLFWKGGWSFR